MAMLARALLLLLPAALIAQTPAPPLPAPSPPPAPAEFAQRRQDLLALLTAAAKGQPFVVLVRGNPGATDMGPFVQDQDFLYLSGVAEPKLALLLAANDAGQTTLDELLVPPHSQFAATWDGDFLAPGDATAQRTGFRTAGNVRALRERLDALLAPADSTTAPAAPAGKPPLLFTLLQPAPRLGSTPTKAAEAAKAILDDPLDGRPSREQALVTALRERHPQLEVRALEPFLTKLRVKKSPAEIALLRASSQAAAAGIAEAMKGARPGLYEFHLAAVARYVFALHGAGPDAYAAIVGAGPNGCILHYSQNRRQLAADDLIVMDYAPTIGGYASDVTRTFPAAGRFSAEQRRLVQDVYDIQQELIAMVKPGARLSAIGRRCSELLRQKGYRSDHGPCHHVGLAVHDPSVDVLEPGMVITVEPGAYLRDRGMGCRIEDTILVTADGHEILSAGLPSSPDAVEALMALPGLLEVPAGLAPGQR